MRRENREKSMHEMIQRTKQIVGSKSQREKSEFENQLAEIERKQRILRQGQIYTADDSAVAAERAKGESPILMALQIREKQNLHGSDLLRKESQKYDDILKAKKD